MGYFESWDIYSLEAVVEAAEAANAAVIVGFGVVTADPAWLAGSRLTDPQQAAQFVAETGIHALAVSVGNVHTLADGKARIDRQRLAAIRRAVAVPLVIHGVTGFADADVVRAIRLGVAKFNGGTALKRAFLRAWLTPSSRRRARSAITNWLARAKRLTSFSKASCACAPKYCDAFACYVRSCRGEPCETI